MNERIKQLAEQATVNRGRMRVVDIEKFAELIVRECALTAGLMEQAGRPNVGAQLLDNFGVEE